MEQCNEIKKDYFNIKIIKLQEYYFDEKYIESANLANILLTDISKYKSLRNQKIDILSYKRLSDFRIEDMYLKTKAKIF